MVAHMTLLLAFASGGNPDFEASVLAAGFYHLLTLLAGVVLCWMGYRLFKLGIVESAAGYAQGVWGNKSIVLKRAAPGTFFSLFGAIVIVVAIINGLDINVKSASTDPMKPADSFEVKDAEVKSARAGGQDNNHKNYVVKKQSPKGHR